VDGAEKATIASSKQEITINLPVTESRQNAQSAIF
jgi:hypothetical protein